MGRVVYKSRHSISITKLGHLLVSRTRGETGKPSLRVRHVAWEEVEGQPPEAIRFPMSGWWVIEDSGDPVAGPFASNDSALEHVADADAPE